MNRGTDRFPTTHWSLVLAAGEHPSSRSEDALATLCGNYWYPLYAFIRRQGYGADEAQDLTQGFFARLLEKHYLRDFRPERGRFRSFLLASLKHFLANERDWVHAQKRGGGLLAIPLEMAFSSGEERYVLEPADPLTPERTFERGWALALLDHVMGRLQEEFARAGKVGQFDALKGFLVGAEERIPHRQIAAELSMTEGAVKVAVHRMRKRFRELLREEISQTVDGPSEVGDEIRYLLSVLAV